MISCTYYDLDKEEDKIKSSGDKDISRKQFINDVRTNVLELIKEYNY